MAGDDLVQDGPQQINVAVKANSLDRSQGHLRCHIGRGTAHTDRRRDVSPLAKLQGGQGQAPVHHEDFAVLAQHDVFRFQVAVDDSAGMGKGHGVGDF